MSGWQAYWAATDGVGRAVATTLLLMSIGSWAVIAWKGGFIVAVLVISAGSLPCV